jgi:Fe-S cluster biogenesis protein NfuA
MLRRGLPTGLKAMRAVAAIQNINSASTCKILIGVVQDGGDGGVAGVSPAEGVAEDRACAGCSEGETSPIFIFS